MIGGLIVATFTTLLLIPNVFAILHGGVKARGGAEAGQAQREQLA